MLDPGFPCLFEDLLALIRWPEKKKTREKASPIHPHQGTLGGVWGSKLRTSFAWNKLDEDSVTQSSAAWNLHPFGPLFHGTARSKQVSAITFPIPCFPNSPAIELSSFQFFLKSPSRRIRSRGTSPESFSWLGGRTPWMTYCLSAPSEEKHNG